MGKYLAALRKLEAGDIKTENAGVVTLINLKNPPTASILGLLGSPHPIFPEKNLMLPAMPVICEALQIDCSEVERQHLLDMEDLVLYETGKYTITQIILYLVSWWIGGQCVPFALLQSDAVRAYIGNLPTDNRRMISSWLSVNITQTTGGGS